MCQRIHDACQKKQIDSEETYSSRAYTSNVRALYYSLLALRLPPTVIKPAVKNVIADLFPSVSEEIRLPGKACASYMRSEEMPTINRIHKAVKLMPEEQCHLNSDGTTLNQEKKVVLLVNGTVLGVHNVSSGCSESTLYAIKVELDKIKDVAAKVDHGNPASLSLNRVISSTSDGASTQSKFNRLL